MNLSLEILGFIVVVDLVFGGGGVFFCFFCLVLFCFCGVSKESYVSIILISVFEI